MNAKNLLLASLIGGLVIAVLSNFPFINWLNCILCMWVWLGGIFAAWLYKRFEGSVTVGQGAAVGALAGLIAGLVGAVISLLGFTGTQAALDAMSQYLGPEVTGGIQLSELAGPLTVFAGIINVLIYALFGVVGGLIGGSIFKSKGATAATVVSTPVVPTPAPQMPPPPTVMPVEPPLQSTPLQEPVEPIQESDTLSQSLDSFSLDNPDEPTPKSDKPDSFS